MSTVEIAEAIARLTSYFDANPDKAYGSGTDATATIDGLRATVTNPDGTVVATDMPAALGGEASAPSPGWLLRAALATCDATVIATRAATEGVALDTLEVTVAFDFDDRGLLGSAEGIPAGPLSSTVSVRIGAAGVEGEKLRGLVEWAERHSPVGDALSRAVPGKVVVEVV